MARGKRSRGSGASRASRLWGDHGSYWNFVQNRRPGVHPGIIDVYLAVRQADRGLAECEDILRGQMLASGLPEDEVEAQMRAIRPRAPEVPPLLATLGLLLARAALLVALNVVGFVAMFLLLTALVRG